MLLKMEVLLNEQVIRRKNQKFNIIHTICNEFDKYGQIVKLIFYN